MVELRIATSDGASAVATAKFMAVFALFCTSSAVVVSAPLERMVKLAAVIATVRPMVALPSLVVITTAVVVTIGIKAAFHSDKQ